MKDKGLYKHGMYGDRDSMGKKAVHRKMGEYFPKQSSQLTEDGMAIDASRTPGMEMYEAGMAQKPTEEEPNPNQAKSGKIYTDEKIASMSDRKKIRKGLAPGVEGEGHDPTKFAYKYDLKGNIKKDTYEVGGETVSLGNKLKTKNPNFQIGGNPDPEGGGSADLNFGPPDPNLPKINFGGGSYKYPKSNKNAHYLKKDGSWRSAKSIARRNKKGFNW